jgi:glyoxylase-like metal-dependent hydrolase (beta-lactamase superfamily II)
MIFTLEALQAKHGDSLLLHYGSSNDPKLIVIDGGPAGVFDKSLRPRLEQIKEARSPDQPLPVRLMMVSHIDDDHIRGILDLTDTLLEQRENNESMLCDITTLWHNSFDEILQNKETDVLAASLNPVVKLSSTGDLSFPPGLFRDHSPAAVAANVPQGRRLRDNAAALTLLANDPFEKLVALPLEKEDALDIGDGLTFTIVGPSKMRLDKLQDDWDKKLKELQKKEAAEARAQAAEFIDRSVYNLASIIVLAEADGKRMLLTGDGLAADILEGLKEAELLDADGKLHVDLLKMPHHGSRRNMTEEFLKAVTADHYVMSANGRHDNPDLATLEMLSELRGAEECTFHLTNPVPFAVEFFNTDRQKPGKKYNLEIREDPALSLRIDLGEPFAG